MCRPHLQSGVLATELRRITADNNLLHRQVIAARDAADLAQRNQSITVKSLEAELNRLSLLATVAAERTTAAERICEALKGRLAEFAHLHDRYEQGTITVNS